MEELNEMKEKSEAELLQEWNALYDQVFPSIKRKHDAVCNLFSQWNSRKIDTKMAIGTLKVLMKE